MRIAEMADEMHLLDNGSFVWSGSGSELLSRPEILSNLSRRLIERWTSSFRSLPRASRSARCMPSPPLDWRLVYGSLNMLNMAHGALLALGGYVCLYAMTALGLPGLLALLIAMAVCGLAGLLIYMLAARPMLASRNFETQIFIATIGIGAVLENVILQPLARSRSLSR